MWNVVMCMLSKKKIWKREYSVDVVIWIKNKHYLEIPSTGYVFIFFQSWLGISLKEKNSGLLGIRTLDLCFLFETAKVASITAMIHFHISIFILLWFFSMLGAGKVSVSVNHVDFFSSCAVGRVSWSFDKRQQHQQLLNFIRDGVFEF